MIPMCGMYTGGRGWGTGSAGGKGRRSARLYTRWCPEKPCDEEVKIWARKIWNWLQLGLKFCEVCRDWLRGGTRIITLGTRLRITLGTHVNPPSGSWWSFDLADTHTRPYSTQTTQVHFRPYPHQSTQPLQLKPTLGSSHSNPIISTYIRGLENSTLISSWFWETFFSTLFSTSHWGFIWEGWEGPFFLRTSFFQTFLQGLEWLIAL